MTLRLREAEGRRLLQRLRDGGDGQREIFGEKIRKKIEKRDEIKSQRVGEKGLNAKIGERARQGVELERECEGMMKAELCPTPEAMVLQTHTYSISLVCNQHTRPSAKRCQGFGE